MTSLRHAVTTLATDCGLSGDRLEDFVVAVNELLTNAVRHGGGSGHVALWRDHGSVVCEVTDHGPGLPESWAPDRARPAGGEPGGLGLWLAGELTDGFAMTTGRDGTVVRISSRLSK